MVSVVVAVVSALLLLVSSPASAEWLLISPSRFFGQHTVLQPGGDWGVMDSFENETDCKAVAARVRAEAFQALEQLRQGKTPPDPKHYPHFWGGVAKAYGVPPDQIGVRTSYIERSRTRCAGF